MANSEGCSRNGPNSPIQLRWPLTDTPIPGTNTANSRNTVSSRNIRENRRTTGIGSRETATIRATPITAKIACRPNRVNAEPYTS